MSLIITLILETIYRATLILGVIYIIDIAQNGEIDLPYTLIRKKWKARDPLSKLLLKIADKLETSLEARKRAWDYRAHKKVDN